jgi:MFS family permease
MQNSATASLPATDTVAVNGGTRHILGFVYFTFICYVSIAMPLAVLPAYVHLKMGYSAALAGLVISVQYIATLSSRPWAGRISDRAGARYSVLWAMAACTASGVLLVAAAFFRIIPWLSVALLIASRLTLGVGESLGATGATLWGIASAGPENTAKVISLNGICTYGALMLGAPLGVLLDQQWGLGALGVFTILIGAVSFVIAERKPAVQVAPGEHLPFAHVLGRVAPHGMGLALSGVGYSVLATFVTLFYASRHWSGAALCLTAFGIGFILARLLFIHTISHFGGYPVAITSLLVEALGMLLLWRAPSPWMAFTGAAVSGFGLSLVYPSLGVEVVKRVPDFNRGSALAVYTVFADVSFFMVGPIAGAIIGFFGYASVFLFGLVSVLGSLAIVLTLAGRKAPEGA